MDGDHRVANVFRRPCQHQRVVEDTVVADDGDSKPREQGAEADSDVSAGNGSPAGSRSVAAKNKYAAIDPALELADPGRIA